MDIPSYRLVIVSPTRRHPGVTTRALIPRRLSALRSLELTNFIASAPKRSTNLAQPVCGCAVTSITAAPIDVAFAGIGENGHLAFNDPPADFDTEEPYIVVDLDERGRLQQVGGGWFASLEEVPRTAITMSIRQILKAHAILCLVSGARKAEAVNACLEGEIGPMAPASALRLHEHATVFLDRDAAALLQRA